MPKTDCLTGFDGRKAVWRFPGEYLLPLQLTSMITTNTNWYARNAAMAKTPIYAMLIGGQPTVYTTHDLAVRTLVGSTTLEGSTLVLSVGYPGLAAFPVCGDGAVPGEAVPGELEVDRAAGGGGGRGGGDRDRAGVLKN